MPQNPLLTAENHGKNSAVIDGKANTKLVVFSLVPYFELCMSRDDDASGRTELFKELGNVH